MSSPLKGAVSFAMDKAWDKLKKRMHLSPKKLVDCVHFERNA